jgi:hypothetical protein
MTAHPRKTRLTLHEPLGMAEPLRPEAVAAGILHRDSQALEQALARIPEAALPHALGVALARCFGRDKGRRIADMAVVHALES